jgi:hypothetical protein
LNAVEQNGCVETLLEGKKRFLDMMSRQGSSESRPSETRRYIHFAKNLFASRT